MVALENSSFNRKDFSSQRLLHQSFRHYKTDNMCRRLNFNFFSWREKFLGSVGSFQSVDADRLLFMFNHFWGKNKQKYQHLTQQIASWYNLTILLSKLHHEMTNLTILTTIFTMLTTTLKTILTLLTLLALLLMLTLLAMLLLLTLLTMSSHCFVTQLRESETIWGNDWQNLDNINLY